MKDFYFNVSVNAVGVPAMHSRDYELTKFKTRAEFYSIARKFLATETGIAKPVLRFSHPTYSHSWVCQEYYSKTSISKDFWGLLGLPKSDLDMLNAYMYFEGYPSGVLLADVIKRVKQDYLGNFKDDTDYANNFLEENEILYNLPDILRNHMDPKALQDAIVSANEDISSYEGYYFEIIFDQYFT